MRRTMSRDPAQQQTEPSGHSGSASSIDSEQLAEQQDGHALTIGQAPSASLPGEHGWAEFKLHEVPGLPLLTCQGDSHSPV